MTTIQRAAFVLGWVLVALGIIGFVTSPSNMSRNSAEAAHIFGLFPVNIIHNVLHLTWGVWGIAASQWPSTARRFARISGVVYVLLAIYGIFSTSFLGLFPIGSNDVWLDATLGIVLGYFGYTARMVEA